MPASEQPGHEQLEVELSRHLINSCSFFFLETVPTFRSSSSAESLDDRDDSLKISTRNRQLEILFDFAISFILCRWNHWSWKQVNIKGVWDEASFMQRQAWTWQQLADLFRVFLILLALLPWSYVTLIQKCLGSIPYGQCRHWEQSSHVL